MSSIYTNTNVSAFNRKQSVAAAKAIAVLTPSSKNDNTLDNLSLITAIKAK